MNTNIVNNHNSNDSPGSSFIIHKGILNRFQREKLRKIKYRDPTYNDSWVIEVRRNGSVSFFTRTDNYDMLKYLRSIGVNTDDIEISYF